MSDKTPVRDFATDWDHTDPQWVADPYPIWADLRERCPVAHTSRYGGAWFPTTHEMVAAIANDTENFTSRQVVIVHNKFPDHIAPAPIGPAPPITSDPPFHQFARRLILPAFAPGPVSALEGPTRALCVRYLERLGDRNSFDAGSEYAQYISPAVISRMLGFPEADDDLFREFVHVVLDLVDLPLEDRGPRLAPMFDYFNEQIEDHRAHPRDDLTSYLLNCEFHGEPLSLDHVRGTMMLTLIAGIDTTWSAIGAAIWHLAQHPGDLARLVDEPELMPVAIEEFLRFYAPVTMARTVARDVRLFDRDLREGDWVLLGFPAANRDPEVFERANEFIIDRVENRHAAFGLGIHRCVGSNLARLELRVALEEFLAHYPRFELADPTAVTWSPGQIRGPRTIPLRVR